MNRHQSGSLLSTRLRCGRYATVTVACGALLLGAAGTAEASSWQRSTFPNELQCYSAYIAHVAQGHRVELCYTYDQDWVLEWYG